LAWRVSVFYKTHLQPLAPLPHQATLLQLLQLLQMMRDGRTQHRERRGGVAMRRARRLRQHLVHQPQVERLAAAQLMMRTAADDAGGVADGIQMDVDRVLHHERAVAHRCRDGRRRAAHAH